MGKIISVFGSAMPQEGEKQYTDAYEIGKLIASKGYGVCTGGYHGIMEAVSKGASGYDVDIVGVTVKHFSRSANTFLTQEIVCDSLLQRLETLINIGDGYIILQGGTGTLLELAAVWEYINKGIIEAKPVCCHSPMWKEIVNIIDKQLKHEGRETGIVKTCNNYEECVEWMGGRF